MSMKLTKNKFDLTRQQQCEISKLNNSITEFKELINDRRRAVLHQISSFNFPPKQSPNLKQPLLIKEDVRIQNCLVKRKAEPICVIEGLNLGLSRPHSCLQLDKKYDDFFHSNSPPKIRPRTAPNTK